jgi:hypothetical protein
MSNDPCDIVFPIHHYIDYWSDLQKPRNRKVLLRGADQLNVIGSMCSAELKVERHYIEE